MTTINEISNHIMGYFDGTLDAFGYTAQSVNEISNPDESYMGTLNLQVYSIDLEDESFAAYISGYIITYASEEVLFENLRENIISHMDLTKGADDQYYDYSPSQVEAILFGVLQLIPEHQDYIITGLKKHLREFIQDDEQDEDMISQYTNIYNAIEKWESDHRETEIFQQLAVSELVNQLNK